jgi:hypothetical protein
MPNGIDLCGFTERAERGLDNETGFRFASGDAIYKGNAEMKKFAIH